MTFICYVVGGFESVWEMEQMISEILSSSSLLRFDDSKNGSLPSCLSHLSQRQKPGRGPAGSDTDADQDSPILQVLLFMEFNLVMHCTRDLYINQPFQHGGLKQWSRGDREEGWGESNDLRIKLYCPKPGERGCCEQHGQRLSLGGWWGLRMRIVSRWWTGWRFQCFAFGGSCASSKPMIPNTFLHQLPPNSFPLFFLFKIFYFYFYILIRIDIQYYFIIVLGARRNG